MLRYVIGTPKFLPLDQECCCFSPDPSPRTRVAMGAVSARDYTSCLYTLYSNFTKCCTCVCVVVAQLFFTDRSSLHNTSVGLASARPNRNTALPTGHYHIYFPGGTFDLQHKKLLHDPFNPLCSYLFGKLISARHSYPLTCCWTIH